MDPSPHHRRGNWERKRSTDADPPLTRTHQAEQEEEEREREQAEHGPVGPAPNNINIHVPVTCVSTVGCRSMGGETDGPLHVAEMEVAPYEQRCRLIRGPPGPFWPRLGVAVHCRAAKADIGRVAGSNANQRVPAACPRAGKEGNQGVLVVASPTLPRPPLRGRGVHKAFPLVKKKVKTRRDHSTYRTTAYSKQSRTLQRFVSSSTFRVSALPAFRSTTLFLRVQPSNRISCPFSLVFECFCMPSQLI